MCKLICNLRCGSFFFFLHWNTLIDIWIFFIYFLNRSASHIACTRVHFKWFHSWAQSSIRFIHIFILQFVALNTTCLCVHLYWAKFHQSRYTRTHAYSELKWEEIDNVSDLQLLCMRVYALTCFYITKEEKHEREPFSLIVSVLFDGSQNGVENGMRIPDEILSRSNSLRWMGKKDKPLRLKFVRSSRQNEQILVFRFQLL